MTPALVFACGWWVLSDGAERCKPGDAQAYIARGHERSDQGDETGALAEFRCAHRLGGSAEALAQVGLAEMALGRWVEAETDLATALAQEQDPWIRQRRVALAAAVEKIRDNLGDLFVDGSPPGAEILIDGRKAAQLPLAGPLRVPTGRRDIHMRAVGYQSVSRERRIEARALARETIELVPLARAPTPAPVLQPAVPPDHHAAGASRWPAWAAAGGSLLFLGAGVGFHVVREQRASEFNARLECGNLPLSQDCSTLADDAKRAERLSIVGYAGGAVLAAMSIYLFVSYSRGDGTSTGRVLACGADLGTIGVTCAGRF
jgi:hypothetical protein